MPALAVALEADQLVFATDVAGVYEDPDQGTAEPIMRLTPGDARALIGSGAATPGSMAPKLESAVDFAERTGRSALICALEDIEAALAGTAGTTVG